MSRFPTGGALLLGIGLAAAPVEAQRARAVIVVPGQVTQVITDTMGTPYQVPFPAGRAFGALAAVYGELKIPAEVRDAAALQVGNPSFYRRGEMGGKQLSTFLSCGDGMTGPYADSYRVYLSLMSTITPDGPDRSTLRTVLLAGAVNVTEGARQPMPCESTGRFEVLIHKMVLKRAAGL